MSYLGSKPGGTVPPGDGPVTVETPSGAIDGSNNVYTVTHTPLWITLNGTNYYEGDGYTRVGLTITLAITPVVGSTLRSTYQS